MLNQTVLVGRLTKEVEKNEKEGKSFAKIVIAVPRSFKNADGVYETDFVPCILWNVIADNTSEYCKKGDLVGIKGRLQSNEEGKLELVAEKVTYLASRKGDDNEDN